METPTLKEAILKTGIKQQVIADEAGISKSTLSQIINHDIWPKEELLCARIKKVFEKHIGRFDFEQDGQENTFIEDGRQNLLGFDTLRYFGLIRNPFLNDINSPKDIYTSESHLFLREMLRAVASHPAFLAISGEVGAGKSTIRRQVACEIEADGGKIIYPQIIDKRKITPASLLDAIILDLTDGGGANLSLEAKSRRAASILAARKKKRRRTVMIVEEAHLLSVDSLKALKQIYELGDGFEKMISIILIGQTELAVRLDPANDELREVVERIQPVTISPLDNVEEYLAHKFRRAGGSLEKVFEPDAVSAIIARFPVAYPQTINNVASTAMTLAARMGESLVTAQLIYKM